MGAFQHFMLLPSTEAYAESGGAQKAKRFFSLTQTRAYANLTRHTGALQEEEHMRRNTRAVQALLLQRTYSGTTILLLYYYKSGMIEIVQ